MPLPWVRLDANVASHDKILSLVADPSPKRWQAMSSYFCAIAWSGGQGTDGLVRTAALPFVHGTATTARLLVKYGLWHERADGWEIHNYADRQETTETTAARGQMLTLASQKANCKRWHGKDCWREETGCAKHPHAAPIRIVK